VHAAGDGGEQRVGERPGELRPNRAHHDPANPPLGLVRVPLVDGDDAVDEGGQEGQRADAGDDALGERDSAVDERGQRIHQ
jgi:hypothetical protein